ncbi:hypothetical protein JI735_30795 [Paenibacillus sonchi]|uniref:Uncharacterized protein n=1 Tax=Paenibacillus sonchi TaxID=373687 RepID=A0A974SCF3_9BACL|nr:hypothetical protein [Paenibacillus sonchi]QQZ60792.1 hypothetical protein JI735_30795 [Paenibacillus sonchi]
MRNISMVLILILQLLLITACRTETEKGDVARTVTSATKITNTSVVPDDSNTQLIDSLIGKWKIDSLYAYGVGGSKNDEQDIKKLIGTEIIFSSDSIKFGNEAEEKPIFYKVSRFSDESFLSDIDWIKESTMDTDLNPQTLKEISLYEDEQYKNFYYGDGNITYYTDKGELILDQDGDLFLLVKMEN